MMAQRKLNSSDESKWTTGSRLVLAAALVFLLLNLLQVGYRFRIPSIGWAGPDPDEEDLASTVFLLETNAVGVPSGLLPGDVLVALDGVQIAEILADFPASLQVPPNWRVGEAVVLTVERDGIAMEVEVPVVHWTVSAWAATNLLNFPGLWSWLVTMLFFGVSALTFFMRPGNLAGRFLFAFGLGNLSIMLSTSVPDPLAYYLNLPAGYAKVFFSNIIFAYLLGPSFLGFTLTFPRPKQFVQKQPLWLLLPYLVGSITILLLVTEPDLAVIGFLFTFMMLLLGIFSLLHAGFTMRDAISRVQLRWAIGGVVTGISLFMLNFFIPPGYREVALFIADLGFPIMSISLAIAILRYRLFDIDIIIRRTLQYALLSAVLAGVYFGGVVLLQRIFSGLSGETDTPIITVLSTLGIAALFDPLRSRIQEVVDRRFFRRKYDVEQALGGFAEIARDEVDIQLLSQSLLKVVEDSMQPDQASLWLRQGEKKVKRRS